MKNCFGTDGICPGTDGICPGTQALTKFYEDCPIMLLVEQLLKFTERCVNSAACFTVNDSADEELITLKKIHDGVCQEKY